MSASHSRREVIHVALGSDACQVTAHWLNDQGAAAALSPSGERFVPDDYYHHNDSDDNDGDDDPPCVADITHSLPLHSSTGGGGGAGSSGGSTTTYLPRALLVDAGSHAFDYFSSSPASTWSGPEASIRPLWHGRVERMVLNEQASSCFQVPTLLDPVSFSTEKKDSFLQQWGKQPPPPTPADDDDDDMARRHVDWDAELRDEMEPSNPDDNPYHQHYDHSYKRLRKDARLVTNRPMPPMESGNEEGWQSQRTTIPWFFPETCLSLPMNPWQDCDDFYNPATSNGFTSHRADWNEEIHNRIRRLLEECDACQGIVVVASTTLSSSSNHSNSSNDNGDAMLGLLWDQLSTSVLHMAQEECPGAKRWMVSVTSQSNQDVNDQPQQTNESLSTRMPRSIRRGLTWNEHVEGAHLLLPLQVPYSSVASVAAALEGISLPYRLSSSSSKHSQHPSLVALQSYYSGSWSGDFPFGTATHLTMHEYVTLLRSSTNSLRSVLELDALVTPLPFPAADRNTNIMKELNLWQHLKIGTSWERRFQDNRLRPATVRPGQWLGPLRADASGSNVGGGLLQSFSYVSDWKRDNRALHHHFSLSTALRTASTTPVSSSSSNKKNDTQVSLEDYATALMEGMGIGVRPEQSMATVLQQTLSSTAHPALAVLGNTTRVYPLLHTIATDMKLGLSARHQSWYNREVANGRLPEIDDCQDALAHCWDVRDAYCPPEGSGLVEKEKESYFDE